MLNKKISRRPARGFTLIELISTIMIIGIAAAVLIHRNYATSEVELDTAAERIISDIYLAQEVSFSHMWKGRIDFIQNATQYSVTASNAADIYKTVAFPQGISMMSADFQLLFGYAGAPETGGPGAWVLMDSVQSVTLTDGSATRTVDIYPYTGYAEVR